MTDIARLAIEADPKQLAAAVIQLDKLSVAAGKAEVEAKKLEKSQTSAALAAAKAAQVTASNAAAIARGSASASKAEKTAAADTLKQATASLNAARAADAQAASHMKAAQAALQQSEAAQRLVTANQAAADSAQNLAHANDNSMRVMGRTAGAQQANMTNIAAQFQDIGVTAAMGMNPMMIGLQQGAQLTGVWGSIAGTTSEKMATFATSIKSVLSPMSLLIIAMTAGLAALIQFVDWTTLAKSSLYALANGLDAVAPYAFAAGTALTIAFAPATLTAILSITAAIGVGLVNALATASMAMISFALLNPFGAALIAVGLLGTAIYTFAEGSRKTFKDVAEFIIDMFIIAYRVVTKTWGMLGPAMDDILAQAVQYSRNRIEQMINAAISGINTLLDMLPDWMKIGSGKVATFKYEAIGNPNAGAAGKLGNVVGGIVSEVRSQDNLGMIQDTIKNFFGDLGDTIRSYADTIGVEKAKKKKSGADKAATGMSDAEKFLKIIQDSNIELWKMTEESKAIGLVGEEAKKAAYALDLKSKAMQQGITLGAKELEIVEKTAAALAAQAQANENLQSYTGQRTAVMENIDNLNAEIAAFGLSGIALAQAQLERKLLNDEIYRGIILSDDQKRVLRELTTEEALLTEQIDKHKKALDFAKGAANGFVGDLKSGLMQGKSLWESWGNAAINVLNKVIDKLLNEMVDAIFKVNSASSGGGGIISSLMSVFGGGLSAGGIARSNATVGSTIAANPGLFAKGGIFTNSVVQRPTQFFAKGGAPGVMGEAGPEAIVPLQRGPDGSLGVQMYGGSGAAAQAPAVVHIVPSEYFDAVVDQRAVNVSAPMVVQGGIASSKMTEANAQRRARRRLR